MKPRHALARAIYSLATWLLLPVALLYFFWRGAREPGYREGWRERLGHVGDVPANAIWVHAASVGEVVLVAPLVEALRRAYADTPLLLTTMTPTGRAQARARFGADVVHRYVPLDTPGATRRFIQAVRPRIAVFAETELWPNLLGAADRARVPVVLVNASVSQRSAARYARWPLQPLVRERLARVAGVGAASALHAERFRRLGVPAARITVTDNLKYDTANVDRRHEAARALRAAWQGGARSIWVAASTHAGEERLLLDAFAALRRRHPSALLVIAPRHPQRFDAVADDLAGDAWNFSRRSEGAPVTVDTAVLLADTLGEVPDFYAAADVVFVGGSLVPGIGGHNVLEAAALAKPLCVGAHVEEWRDIIEALIECGAARECAAPEALAAATAAWLDDPDRARADGLAGARLVESRRGALARSLTLIERVMD